MSESTFAISPLLRKTAEEKGYTPLLEKALNEVVTCFPLRLPGYRDGVVLVPIPLPDMPAQVVRLKEGEALHGAYVRRVPGEEPRQSTWVERPNATPSQRVEIVCYRHDVLAENNEQSSEADWELIAILAGESPERIPVPPNTFLANHYRLSGGTSTLMDPVTFEQELKKSVCFWKDHAHLKIAVP